MIPIAQTKLPPAKSAKRFTGGDYKEDYKLSMMILMNEMIIMLTVGRRIQPANGWLVFWFTPTGAL